MSRSLFLILLLGISCLELHQARSLPEHKRQRFVRRRISPDDPDLEIIEVKEVYYVRRPKKVVVPLDDDELDWRIRCDFDPSLAECVDYVKKPVAATRPPTTTTTTTTAAPTTTTSTTTTTRRPTTTTTEPADESLERRIRCEFDPTAEECAPSTTSTTPSTTSTTTTTEIPVPSESDDYIPSLEVTENTRVSDYVEVEEKVSEGTDSDEEIPLVGPFSDEEPEDQVDQEDLEDQEDDADMDAAYDLNDSEMRSIGAHDDGNWN
ncbi:zinc metalloproteinase nas-14 [Drosophila teissieri]|uniref:zinc metalloproteinase nas-14 n=1 Tax=Drosophila teissieri TaxID=7243 RepID=UPI001CBA3FE8|nr:zinc metalloproteinase nas-14 [Drosophila teissieri]